MRAQPKIAGLLLLAGVLAWSGPASARDCQANPDRYCDHWQPQTISLRIYRNFLVVAKGKLGNASESQNFILDTGTAPSIISEKLVRQLGVATVRSTFRVAGKTVPAQVAIIPQIELGPIRVLSLPVYVQDLSIERDLGIPVEIAGIIGLDVLSKYSFRLDYDKREIEFGDISRVGIPVNFDARAGLAVANVRIEGKEARLLVDTGSDRLVLFGGNFTEAGWPALRNTSQWGVSPVDQKMYVQLFSATDIILGGQHFRDDMANFLPGSADPAFDGLLGVRALGFRALSYDKASKTIYLQK